MTVLMTVAESGEGWSSVNNHQNQLGHGEYSGADRGWNS